MMNFRSVDPPPRAVEIATENVADQDDGASSNEGLLECADFEDNTSKGPQVCLVVVCHA